VGPRFLTLALVAAAGCGDHADAIEPDAPVIETGFPSPMMIAATSAHVSLPFAATVAEQTAGGPTTITSDVGTVGVAGDSVPAFVYVAIPFAGYTLYQGFGVAPARWDVFWLYCQGTALSYVYDEAVTGAPLVGRPTTGSCSGTTATTDAAVSLPAFAIAPPSPRPGFVVDGAQIAVAANGTGTYGGLPLIAFDLVDCSTGCGTPGWYELHSLVWDEAHQRVTFVIVYLTIGQPNAVQLAYARSLPDLADPIGDVVVPATWSIPSAALARRGPGIPPPRARL